MANNKIKFLETKYFGLLLGLAVFLLCLLIQSFSFFRLIDLAVLDANFNLRNVVTAQSTQVGVSEVQRNPKISPDILIASIDTRSLARFGRWPWPRFRHADFINTLARIKDQSSRERATLLDVFFNEPSETPEDDALLKKSMEENKRIYLETLLDDEAVDPANLQVYYERQQALFKKEGQIVNVKGNWKAMPAYFDVEPPLKPFAEAVRGSGHATYKPDIDQTFRHQAMIIRTSFLTDTIKLDDLTTSYTLDESNYERLGWTDKSGNDHTVAYPLNADVLAKLKKAVTSEAPPVVEDDSGDGSNATQYFVVYKYRDYFVPSITLALALDYFNKKPEDVEVQLGQYIRIPSPQYFDTKAKAWVPYRIELQPAEYNDNQEEVKPAVYKDVPEIKIPIDDNALMLINFMGSPSSEVSGGYQTFPIRSYAGYAARATGPDSATWPNTLTLDNKIIMAGAFAHGIASDDKKTPLGIMFGIEVHANALNSILMDNFIYPLPPWLNIILIFVASMLVAFIASRLSTPLSMAITFGVMIVFFFSTSLIFDASSTYINFGVPCFAMIFTLLVVVAYRVMTEEREKKRIHSMFGKYVSKEVVDQMVEVGQQPELGGVDKELTVYFSDIRGFTSLSETMTPQELVNHLNVYLTAMTDIIMEYRGTLDKYIGDAIMCFWGAPVPQSDHALLACKCALRQMDKLKELNANWPPEKQIDIGIGINSGIMTVGNMGSLGRLNYTLMGDNVNLGSRLEGTNKQYYTNILISEYTYGLVRDKVVARELDNIRVKGKNKPVLIYELIDVLEDNVPPK